ncbi:uncharacterized protein J3R85_007008 [Psidium guajava]|nr:uncharacterized protein J3R85_007008 [Psidium guajava]
MDRQFANMNVMLPLPGLDCSAQALSSRQRAATMAGPHQYRARGAAMDARSSGRAGLDAQALSSLWHRRQISSSWPCLLELDSRPRLSDLELAAAVAARA